MYDDVIKTTHTVLTFSCVVIWWTCVFREGSISCSCPIKVIIYVLCPITEPSLKVTYSYQTKNTGICNSYHTKNTICHFSQKRPQKLSNLCDIRIYTFRRTCSIYDADVIQGNVSLPTASNYSFKHNLQIHDESIIFHFFLSFLILSISNDYSRSDIQMPGKIHSNS